MLIKAEHICKPEEFRNISDYEAMQIVKHELGDKIIDLVLEKGLIKQEIWQGIEDGFGAVTKIRYTTRAYNPDD